MAQINAAERAILENCMDKIHRRVVERIIAKDAPMNTPEALDAWAKEAFKPHYDAINQLFGGRLIRTLFDGCEMKSSKRFWSWDHIRKAALLELERGDTSHDWQSLIDLIHSYHGEADESPTRDLK